MKPTTSTFSQSGAEVFTVQAGLSFLENVQGQLEQVRAGHSKAIRLSPGRHEVHASALPRRACFVSNHDAGVRAVLFDLNNLNDITIDGQGAELVFHGEVIPFLATGCRNITVRDLTLDWARPFLSQGLVLNADEGQLDLEMDANHPFEVQDDRPVFTGDEYRSDSLHNMLAFDPARRETAFRARDHYGVMKSLRAEAVDPSNPHRLRLFGKFEHPTPAGQVIVIKHHSRAAPGLCFIHCDGVDIENVTVHHAGGMGFVAQASRNLKLSRCAVAPRAGSDRMFSTHADATHFTDCYGKIELLDCTFENQLDDATNIHGVYRRIDGGGKTRQVKARLVHHQQDGLHTVAAGDELAFTDDRDFTLIGHARVTEVEHPDTATAVYTLDREVDLRDGHTVAMRWDHDINVRIAGCTAGKNRARGFLVSTLGRVMIENNTLHTPGSAIQCCCDASSWYESGPVENVTVIGNRFNDCLYGVWGRALIAVNPVLNGSSDIPPVNKNIRVIDNDIVSSDPRLVFARSVAGFEFTDNRLVASTTYPRDTSGPAFDFDASVEPVERQAIDEFTAAIESSR
ncbi:MAG: hypothetical protein AAF086_00945 [Planctomycetota bacterium]